MRRNAYLLTAVFALTALLAYGGQVRDRDATWLAPAEEASRSNPLAARADVLAGGRKLFHQRCATCHGDDGGGTTKAPDLTQPGVQSQSDGALFWKISGGRSRHGMPAFSFLPAPQRWQLVLQIKTLVAPVLEAP